MSCPRCGGVSPGLELRDGVFVPSMCALCEEITLLGQGEPPDVAHDIPALKQRLNRELAEGLREVFVSRPKVPFVALAPAEILGAVTGKIEV